MLRNTEECSNRKTDALWGYDTHAHVDGTWKVCLTHRYGALRTG